MAVFLVPRAQLFISENRVHINRKQWVSKGCVVVVAVRGGGSIVGKAMVQRVSLFSSSRGWNVCKHNTAAFDTVVNL